MTEIGIRQVSVLHLNAGNDPNGNPRRVYVLIHPHYGVLSAIDEGYSGKDALRDVVNGNGSMVTESQLYQLREAIQWQIDTSVKTYKAFVKRGPRMPEGYVLEV